MKYIKNYNSHLNENVLKNAFQALGNLVFKKKDTSHKLSDDETLAEKLTKNLIRDLLSADEIKEDLKQKTKISLNFKGTYFKETYVSITHSDEIYDKHDDEVDYYKGLKDASSNTITGDTIHLNLIVNVNHDSLENIIKSIEFKETLTHEFIHSIKRKIKLKKGEQLQGMIDSYLYQIQNVQVFLDNSFTSTLLYALYVDEEYEANKMFLNKNYKRLTKIIDRFKKMTFNDFMNQMRNDINPEPFNGLIALTGETLDTIDNKDFIKYLNSAFKQYTKMTLKQLYNSLKNKIN